MAGAAPSLATPCPACAQLNSAEAPYCMLCGTVLANDDSIHADGSAVADVGGVAPGGRIREYRLLRRLSEFADVRGFLGVREAADGSRTPVVVRVRDFPAGQAPEQKPNQHLASADTIRLVPGDVGVDHLHAEYDILTSVSHPSLPEVIDYFEEGDQALLVETAAVGTPLLTAWTQPGIRDVQRLKWIDDIRQALQALHKRDVVLPSLQPNRIVVGADGRARIRDVGGMAKLPISFTDRIWHTLYAAPEVVASPVDIDLRSDSYTLGAILYALNLGRELEMDDFQSPGVPKPFALRFPDAPPPLLRLLSKTVVTELHTRFPASSKRSADPSGFEEIGGAIAELSRSFDGIRYDIAGWSSTGIQRENNEDCFTVSSLCAGAAEHRRDMALVCVADGMGGLASGEVASAMAVNAVAEYLRSRGLSSAAMDRFGADHPFHDLKRAASYLEEAVHEANRAVYAAAQQGPNRSQMGCTIEAMLIVGRTAILYHVGDSRVYHRHGKSIRQVTADQTLVNRLVERGELSAAEAENHPYKSAIIQAVGAQMVVDPTPYQIQLDVGDWLVVCTDGLSNHVPANDLNEVVSRASCAEVCARRLINLANQRGGADNCTVVVIHAR